MSWDNIKTLNEFVTQLKGEGCKNIPQGPVLDCALGMIDALEADLNSLYEISKAQIPDISDEKRQEGLYKATWHYAVQRRFLPLDEQRESVRALIIQQFGEDRINSVYGLNFDFNAAAAVPDALYMTRVLLEGFGVQPENKGQTAAQHSPG